MPKVELEKLRFETLETLDPAMALVFVKAVAQIQNDLTNRPGDKSARKIKIEMSFIPYSNQQGELLGVKSEMKCSHHIPPARSAEYDLRPHVDTLAFNRQFPDSANQIPLFPSEVRDPDE